MPSLIGSKLPHPEISSVLSLFLPLDFRGEVIPQDRNTKDPVCLTCQCCVHCFPGSGPPSRERLVQAGSDKEGESR